MIVFIKNGIIGTKSIGCAIGLALDRYLITHCLLYLNHKTCHVRFMGANHENALLQCLKSISHANAQCALIGTEGNPLCFFEWFSGADERHLQIPVDKQSDLGLSMIESYSTRGPQTRVWKNLWP